MSERQPIIECPECGAEELVVVVQTEQEYSIEAMPDGWVKWSLLTSLGERPDGKVVSVFCGKCYAEWKSAQGEVGEDGIGNIVRLGKDEGDE